MIFFFSFLVVIDVTPSYLFWHKPKEIRWYPFNGIWDNSKKTMWTWHNILHTLLSLILHTLLHRMWQQSFPQNRMGDHQLCQLVEGNPGLRMKKILYWTLLVPFCIHIVQDCSCRHRGLLGARMKLNMRKMRLFLTYPQMSHISDLPLYFCWVW